MCRNMLFVCLTVISLATQASYATEVLDQASVNFSQDRPLFFTENKGQWDERVLFKADGTGGLTWWIERDGFTVLFSVPDMKSAPNGLGESSLGADIPGRSDFDDHLQKGGQELPPSKSHALKFKFQNALPRTAGGFLPETTTPALATSVESTEQLAWNNNYFLGNDESKWAPNCGNFQHVTLKEVWPGVDVAWRTSSLVVPAQAGIHPVEFDFQVHPNADPNAIRVEILGLTGEMEAVSNGEELLLPTSLGGLRQALPEAFQVEEDGSLSPVRAKFKLSEDNTSFGVALPEGWDKGKKLVVDPLVYSTFQGGTGDDRMLAVISDGEDGIIASGLTTSQDFPMIDGPLGGGGSRDAVVSRFSTDGSLLFSTVFGGTGVDNGQTLTLDGLGRLVVAGMTYSTNFPIIQGAFDEEFNTQIFAAYVARFSAMGDEITYSSYIEGNDADLAIAICSDGTDEGVIVAGWTNGGFPTTQGVSQSNYGGREDAFIIRLNLLGNGPNDRIYGSYLGGPAQEIARAIIPDGEGGCIVTGDQYSGNFPTTVGAYQRIWGGHIDGFVTRLNGSGVRTYSSYLGVTGHDFIRAIVSDGFGGAIVAGYTNSSDWPTDEHSFQRDYGSANQPSGNDDGFVARLSLAGAGVDDLVFCTYYGGNSSDYIYALAADGAGGCLMAGETWSSNLPRADGPIQQNYGGGAGDAFIARLNPVGSSLLYGSYWGGNGADMAYGITLDDGYGVVIAGRTASANFPTFEAIQAQKSDGFDAFITKLDIGIVPPIDIAVSPASLDFGNVEFRRTSQPLTLTVTNDGSADLEVTDMTIADGQFAFTFGGAFTLAEGASREFPVTFTPNVEGEVVSELVITSNDPDESPLSVPLSGTGVWVPSSVLLDRLCAQVQALRMAGVLNQGQANSLCVKIRNAYNRLERNQPSVAISMLEAFNHEVNAYIGNVLTEEQGLPLIAEANFIIALITEFGTAGFDGHLVLAWADLPSEIYLSEGFPNPFNSTTRIAFGLPEASRVKVNVYDVAGRQVANLVEGRLEAGNHSALWKAEGVSSGVYLVKMEASNFSATRKVTLVK